MCTSDRTRWTKRQVWEAKGLQTVARFHSRQGSYATRVVAAPTRHNRAGRLNAPGNVVEGSSLGVESTSEAAVSEVVGAPVGEEIGVCTTSAI